MISCITVAPVAVSQSGSIVPCLSDLSGAEQVNKEKHSCFPVLSQQLLALTLRLWSSTCSQLFDGMTVYTKDLGATYRKSVHPQQVSG